MNSITQSGLSTINHAFDLANRSAHDIASSIAGPEVDSAQAAETSSSSFDSNPPTITESVVNLALAELQSKAGVKVLQTADAVLGTLIDTKV